MDKPSLEQVERRWQDYLEAKGSLELARLHRARDEWIQKWIFAADTAYSVYLGLATANGEVEIRPKVH